jgi:RNA polymerase sigma factor (sigma-70 family)
VTRRVARKVGRSPETIRYTLKRHDRECPRHAVFPTATGPLGADAKTELYRQYRRGTAVDVLAKRYCRTRTSIYRVISEVRAERLLSQPLDYMYHESFDRRSADREILSPAPEAKESHRQGRVPQGLPPYLASLYEVPLLSREQEAYLFRKMNYLKYKAARLREGLDPKRAKSDLMDEIESRVEQALAVKNQIIRANLRLVVSIAKRHVGPSNNFFELVSDGNMSLIRAVEKFDYSRGNKFSTYATWAIMKNYARSIPEEKHRRDRFRTGSEDMFEAAPDNRSDEFEQEAGLKRMRQAIGKILEKLDDRERQIIISRFGLRHEHEPQTLEQVGTHFGVTKERIRQIEARALNKLRQFAREEKIEVPGD